MRGAEGLGELGELGLVRRLRPYLAPASADLVIGAGEDDAAAWREPGGGYTVATCDTAVEGVHFDLGWQAPADAGWRALAFALGDLAAKGARPTFGLASLSVPPSWTAATVEAVYGGMAELAAECGLRIAGGDTTATPGPASLTLALLGRTELVPIPRSAARPGWRLAVSGPLGGGEAGLAARSREEAWRRPRPRLGLGRELLAAGLCAGDISDGLLRELDKFRECAGVGARIRLDAVPVAPGASLDQALAGGEEVELVVVGAAPDRAGLIEVGELTADGRVVVVDAAGRELSPTRRGYDHFT